MKVEAIHVQSARQLVQDILAEQPARVGSEVEG